MRKLTGYIGAMIIVIALMGSILAGYALNVNGTSTVMNEYEKVTDVSGLYTHTQEPSYIDYNPASNYIGYNVEQSDTFTVNNNSSLNYGLSYKLYKSSAPNCAWNSSQFSSGAFYVNGGVVHYSTTSNQTNVTAFRTVIGDTVTAYVWAPDGTNATTELHINDGRYWSANFTITYSGSTVTFKLIDNNNLTLSSACNWLLMPDNNGDYVPILNGGTGYYQNEIEYNVGSLPASTVINEWSGQPVYNFYSITNAGSNAWVFVPKTFNYQPIQDKGINYTESNRVNNYLMETTNTTITYFDGSVNMATLGAPDVFYYNSYGTKQIGNAFVLYSSITDETGHAITPIQFPTYTIGTPALLPNSNGIYDSNNPIWNYDGWHNVRLSNVLASFNAPSGTTSIKITTDSLSSQTFNYPYTVTLDKNLVWFSYIPDMAGDYGRVPSLNTELNKKDYLIYDVQNNIATVYTYDGTLRYSSNPDNIGVFYYYDNATHKGRETWRIDTDHNTLTTFYDMYDRPAPTIKLTATITTPGTLKYADITKGYAVKSGNIGDVVWNNNYQNGNVQLLFRAENTPGTYHNGLIVGDNNISIDYNTNRYLVTLNGGDPVDIGTWRNIILDIDMINGELSVIPVRTFNSFTNVETDNTNIFIGDLINPTPTNIIRWVPTTNSLMFNIYSTSVFMNTYGVVMVNPTLNITDYFTNLDNFYQLKISNISVVGQSMTVNGITGIVTGNTITFNDETIQIKDMAITYADGHTYISDSHVTIDLGEITDNNISMSGAWYFITDLMRGYTTQKMIYEWDWQDFILDNVQFCIIYIGLALIGILIARRYCTLTITDYAIFMVSIIIALTVQVIA